MMAPYIVAFGANAIRWGLLHWIILILQTPAAERAFMEAGAHYAMNACADMPTVVEQIESRLRQGAAGDRSAVK